METLIIRPNKNKLIALKETLENMEIPCVTTNDRIYNEAFEKKLRKSDAAFAKGEYTVITPDDLKKKIRL